MIMLVLPESVTAFPGLGIQLETARGIDLSSLLGSTASLRTSRQRTFVPLAQLPRQPGSIILHEALRRWSIVYYLAIVRQLEPQPGRKIRQVVIVFPVRTWMPAATPLLGRVR